MSRADQYFKQEENEPSVARLESKGGKVKE